MKNGIYKNMEMDEYHCNNGHYSKTFLSDFSKSPLYANYKKRFKKKRHFEMGTAVHSLILEGYDAFESRLAVIPDDVLSKSGTTNTSAYREWEKSEAIGKNILKKKDANLVKEIAERAFSKRVFRDYLSTGVAEMSCFWHEDFNGIELGLKCRPDFLPKNGIVVDLKTTGDIHKFYKSARDFKYHWSSWLTCRGLTTETGYIHSQYIFAVVEINEPFDSAIYFTTQEQFDMARYEIEQLLPSLAHCHATNEWPGIEDRVFPLPLNTYRRY